MTIDEKTTYTATSLPGAQPRETREEAEADEARGVELAEYLAVLPTLTEEQWARGAAWVEARGAAWVEAWDAARDAARVEARVEAWDAARVEVRDTAWDTARDTARVEAWDAAWRAGAAWDAAWDAACAIIARDLITPVQFDTLTAPMRAAGVNFDALANHEDGSK